MTTQLLLFSANDTSADSSYWTLDTASHPNLVKHDLLPNNYVGYGGLVYFEAFAANFGGLWFTDGSSAHEVTGIANTPAPGVFPTFEPSELTVFNNLIYFGATDAAGHPQLWVSDGTAANTHEIIPANSRSTGLFDGTSPDFAVYNGSLYFAGRDASNKELLWISDGSAANTHILLPATNLEFPSDLVTFNGSLYFIGYDYSFTQQLWQSDGTAAGTHNVTSSGLSAQDLTPYTSPTLGTTLLYFAGSDSTSTGTGLWVTDGTEAGTHEITGIANASSGGVNPFDLTVYNGRLYFDGSRADGENSLWTSDGTAAGTHEIVVPGANYGGSHGGFNPGGFTVFNGLLYFHGVLDSGFTTGNTALLVTDGTTVNQVPLGAATTTNPDVDNLFAATFGAPNVPPSVTINQGSSQSDPTTSGPILFDVVFSESVTGFDGSDISFTGSTAPGTLGASVTGSGATYTVSVSGMTGSGTVTAGIAAGRAQDSDGADNTASTSTDNTVTFTFVPAANQAPVNSVPGSQSVNEDTGLVFSGGNGNAISISDADAGGGAEQVTLSVLHGALTLATTSGLSFSTGDGTADATMTFTGNLTAINNALNGLSYLGSANFNGSDTLTVNTNDQGNTGAGGAQADQDTVAITVNAVNDTPVNSVPGSQSVNEDAALVFSNANSNTISTADLDAGGGAGQLTLSVAHGSLTLATTSGLSFTTGDGTADATMTFTGTFANINAALNGLTYLGNSNYNGADILTINTNDQGNTGSGGALSDQDTVAITVNPVNDAPSITSPTGSPATIGVAENTTAVTTVVGADPDGDTITYSLSGGADQAKFQIDAGSGALSFISAPDFAHPTDSDLDGHYLVTVRASDGSVFADESIDVLVENRAAPIAWLGSPGIGQHPLGWQFAGVGDFNHDGIADVLWRETATGRVDEWQLASGGQWGQSINLGTHEAGWQVAGVGDFTGDGTSDVLWRNSATGHLDLWVMVNGQWSQSNDLGSHGTDWTVLGVGDFNGDHTSDILFQNPTSGALDSWKMANGQWASSTPLGTQTSPWNFGGIGDANADGTSDIFWRNGTTGQVNEWRMSGGNWAQTLDLGNFNPAFQLAAVNDFNGDGTADILWRNPTSGQVETWALLNGAWSSSSSLGSFDPAFRLGGTGGLDHGGGADAIWHSAATGQVGEWLLGS